MRRAGPRPRSTHRRCRQRGVIIVDVDGTSFEFVQGSIGILNFECQLGVDRVELDFQSQDNSDAMHLEYGDMERIGGEAGTWAGLATFAPGALGSGEAYRADGTVLGAGAVTIDPPYVELSVPVSLHDSATDMDPDVAGDAVVRANCSDASAAAGGADTEEAPVTGVGTPDSDGDVVVIEVDGRIFDLGAVVPDISCFFAADAANASAVTEARSGGTIGFETILYDVDLYDFPDLPFVYVVDDDAGVAYVAGQPVGRSDIDPGGSVIEAVSFDGDSASATAQFIEVGGSPTELITGTITIDCP